MHNASSLNIHQNKSPALVVSRSKQSSTSSETAHDMTPHAADTSPPMAAHETSHKCSTTQSAYIRCYGFWRKQGSARNREPSGTQARQKHYLQQQHNCDKTTQVHKNPTP